MWIIDIIISIFRFAIKQAFEIFGAIIKIFKMGMVGAKSNREHKNDKKIIVDGKTITFSKPDIEFAEEHNLPLRELTPDDLNDDNIYNHMKFYKFFHLANEEVINKYNEMQKNKHS